jgi:signal peptidase II
MQRSNGRLFWPIVVLVAAVDYWTKNLAALRLLPERFPHEMYGEWVRFTLVHNTGAAFGLHIGDHSRWIFMALTVVALVILGWLYAATRPGDVMRTLSLALVCGGAVGNLVDRIRSPFGVVDFIDIGFGDSRWPTFNVADMAVSIGAVLLAWVLWDEDTRTARVPEASSSIAASSTVAADSRELS